MKLRLLVIGLCILLLLFVTAIIESFDHSMTEAPVPADVIIMLGGDDRGRLEKAAELYHAGFAEQVMISPINSEYYSQSMEFAIALGIPEDAVIEETEATSTYTNAVLTLEMMEELNFESALVVTSDFHMKRSMLSFERVNAGRFELTYVAALSENGEKWHERSYARLLWAKEFYKIWGYRLGLYKVLDLPDD
ncbi:YdcF family protein [Lacicoccus alkaliphilus]|uniref:YdcF family protein n=1 Tax=Lacicoccus alkaliphilus TaxID=148453 RepID=UPI0009347D47|nr:YdcF family protein [Salinicoccus alkaliphilus]